MKFPSVGDIASRKVVSIDITKTISDAIEKMIHNEHRDIVVKDFQNYYILTALDIIEINKKNINLDT
ncbi:MAG: CBS domain-containing protein, partial [Sulfurimonas sp.]|nr:CBS domain-containing protein [Sulfurimonas sp.]